MTETLTTWGGWAPAIRDDPFRHLAEARLRLATGRESLTWAHGDGLVLRGLTALPVVLGRERRAGGYRAPANATRTIALLSCDPDGPSPDLREARFSERPDFPKGPIFRKG